MKGDCLKSATLSIPVIYSGTQDHSCGQLTINSIFSPFCFFAWPQILQEYSWYCYVFHNFLQKLCQFTNLRKLSLTQLFFFCESRARGFCTTRQDDTIPDWARAAGSFKRMDCNPFARRESGPLFVEGTELTRNFLEFVQNPCSFEKLLHY